MEIIHAKDAKRIEDGDAFVAYESSTKDTDLNIARVELSGRYPKQGTMRNNEVKEIVYVSSGSGKVTIEGNTEDIGQGDVIFYEKGEQVYWEGTLSLIIACSPAWTPDQHEFIP